LYSAWLGKPTLDLLELGDQGLENPDGRITLSKMTSFEAAQQVLQAMMRAACLQHEHTFYVVIAI
jgi:hypothetical protein